MSTGAPDAVSHKDLPRRVRETSLVLCGDALLLTMIPKSAKNKLRSSYSEVEIGGERQATQERRGNRPCATPPHHRQRRTLVRKQGSSMSRMSQTGGRRNDQIRRGSAGANTSSLHEQACKGVSHAVWSGWSRGSLVVFREKACLLGCPRYSNGRVRWEGAPADHFPVQLNRDRARLRLPQQLG